MRRTYTYECEVLGKRVQTRTNSAEIAGSMQFWLRGFSGCGRRRLPFDLVISVELTPPTTPGGRSWVTVNGQPVSEFQSAWQVLPLLQMQIGAYLPAAVSDYVLLHAGAVARSGGGLLLPAASGGGKSTLTLALFLHGLNYYSDEVAVISPAGGELHPFPKPIASRNPTLHPALAGQATVWAGPALQPDGPVWYAQAEDIRPGPTARPVPIRHLIFPRYVPGASARLEPLSTSEAMRGLLANTVNFAALRGQALEVLGRLARTAPAYSLTSSDPAAAAALVAGLS